MMYFLTKLIIFLLLEMKTWTWQAECIY